MALDGPLRMNAELSRRSSWSLTSHFSNEINAPVFRISEKPTGELLVEFAVTARSRTAAEAIGQEYAEQICDLLSAITQSTLRCRPERSSEATCDAVPSCESSGPVTKRELTVSEWDWVAESLVGLRLRHPQFVSAAGWQRKALLSDDPLEQFCCYFQVIERVASAYAPVTAFPFVGDPRLPEDNLLSTLSSELCHTALRKVNALRDRVMSGKRPNSPELVNGIREILPNARSAATLVLDTVRKQCLCNGQKNRAGQTTGPVARASL